MRTRGREGKREQSDRARPLSCFTLTRDPPPASPPLPPRVLVKHRPQLALLRRKDARFCPASVLGRRRRPLLRVRPPGRCREAARFGRRRRKVFARCCLCLCFDADRSRRRSPHRQVRGGMRVVCAFCSALDSFEASRLSESALLCGSRA